VRLPPFIVSLDVETVGLYGQPFAWAVSIADTKKRETVVEAVCRCPFDIAMGTPDDREWCQANVLPALAAGAELGVLEREVASVEELLNAFGDVWRFWHGRQAWLLVDHGYPVEAEFLFNAFMEAFLQKKPPFPSPYPVLDYASMRAGRGLEPTETLKREAGELPQHHPLADARQTLRLFWDMLTPGAQLKAIE
jgi:hypothetical protein